MIFAMSDIHGHYSLMETRINQIRPLLEDNHNKLILLGDYIDRGKKSYQCLKLAHDLEEEYGRDRVIVLKGNHEVWFEEFLYENEDVWLNEDEEFLTSGTFLTEEQFRGLDYEPDRESKIDYLKKCIKEKHKDLLAWMRKLRLSYETDTQIFVHAGVDEDIPEEEAQWCVLGTPDYVMTGKFPPSTGHFYKDIIAGHVAASHVAGNPKHKGIYFDGESHFYIDGSSGKNKKILCLAFDENEHKYYELEEDGSMREIVKRGGK